MKLYKEKDKIYNQYEVANTDYIVEICEEPINKDYIEVWLYRLGFGVKQLMFCITKTKDFEKIIELNVMDYIKLYEEDVQE